MDRRWSGAAGQAEPATLSRYAQAAEGAKGLGGAHAAMLDYVPSGSYVLDVGCSSGYLAAALSQRGCRTVGIELDPADAMAARQHCEAVIEGDIEQLDLGACLGNTCFDVVIFGDVLEHLRSPDKILTNIQPYLCAQGQVVVSIPNVAHASVRLQLLLGGFWYAPVGLLDETHLRFFTLESFVELAWRCGFEAQSVTRIEEPVNPELWAAVLERLRLDASATQVLARELAQPSATSFQYVVLLAPHAVADGDRPSYLERPAWTRPLTDYLAERDAIIQRLQQQLDGQTAWAQTSAAQVTERDEIIRHLQEQLAEQTAWAQSCDAQVKERDEIIRTFQEQADMSRQLGLDPEQPS